MTNLKQNPNIILEYNQKKGLLHNLYEPEFTNTNGYKKLTSNITRNDAFLFGEIFAKKYKKELKKEIYPTYKSVKKDYIEFMHNKVYRDVITAGWKSRDKNNLYKKGNYYLWVKLESIKLGILYQSIYIGTKNNEEDCFTALYQHKYSNLETFIKFEKGIKLV